MNVLVTGHRGYIGAHLVDLLKRHGHRVVGCDLNLFEGCAWSPVVRPDVELLRDVRSLRALDLEGIDCVMHLAAISNDPMGDLAPGITEAVNSRASVELARRAKAAGVPRFLFASSCAMYGRGAQLDLDESAELNPVSAYARSKIEAETAIRALADRRFCPVYLRNATAYGASPMLRIDLVANNLLASAFAHGEVRVMSDGTSWRPLIHARDIAAAFIAFMGAPAAAVHNRAINVGANAENYQVRDVAAAVARLVPGAGVVFTGEVGQDPRNYRVKFDLLDDILPGFRLAYTLETGLEELARAFTDGGFGLDDFAGDRYVRLRTLKKRLHRLNGPIAA